MPLRVSVEVEQWLRTGRFGPLAIGDTASDLIRLLGETEWYGPKARHQFPGYWLYDEVEFGFDANGNIEWIQSDTVRMVEARADPTYVNVDWQGVFHQMPLNECQRWLEQHKLAYRTTITDEAVTLTIENETQMLLTDASDPRLVTVWCPANSNLG
jgi:hypothetical protein